MFRWTHHNTFPCVILFYGFTSMFLMLTSVVHAVAVEDGLGDYK